MDLSYENYTPPEITNTTEVLTKEEEFIKAVTEIAKNLSVEFVVATRDGKYAWNIKESNVLKEVASTIVEINGRPENIRNI